MTNPNLKVKLTLEDAEGRTKETFDLSPDQAFAIQTLLHSFKGTAPQARASWVEACKAAQMLQK